MVSVHQTIWCDVSDKHVKNINFCIQREAGGFSDIFQSGISLWDTWRNAQAIMKSWDERRRTDEERRDGNAALLYLRQGGACLFTSCHNQEGRMGRDGWRTARVWLVGWMEWAEESGWRHGGVLGTDTDNKEKPGHTLHYYRHSIRSSVGLMYAQKLHLIWSFSGKSFLKGQFHQPLLFYQTHWHLIVAVMLWPTALWQQ